MKRLFLLAVAAMMLSSFPAEPAQAAGERPVYRSGTRSGPLARLLELERRKNAWIRQTIFRR